MMIIAIIEEYHGQRRDYLPTHASYIYITLHQRRFIMIMIFNYFFLIVKDFELRLHQLDIKR